MSETAVDSECLGHGFMACKLFTVIRGDGVDVGGRWREHFVHSVFHALGSPGRHFGDEHQTCCALGQGDDNLLMSINDDGLKIPITDTPRRATMTGRSSMDTRLRSQPRRS